MAVLVSTYKNYITSIEGQINNTGSWEHQKPVYINYIRNWHHFQQRQKSLLMCFQNRLDVHSRTSVIYTDRFILEKHNRLLIDLLIFQVRRWCYSTAPWNGDIFALFILEKCFFSCQRRLIVPSHTSTCNVSPHWLITLKDRKFQILVGPKERFVSFQKKHSAGLEKFRTTYDMKENDIAFASSVQVWPQHTTNGSHCRKHSRFCKPSLERKTVFDERPRKQNWWHRKIYVLQWNLEERNRSWDTGSIMLEVVEKRITQQNIYLQDIQNVVFHTPNYLKVSFEGRCKTFNPSKSSRTFEQLSQDINTAWFLNT